MRLMKRVIVVALAASLTAGCSFPIEPDGEQARAFANKDVIGSVDAGVTSSNVEFLIPSNEVGPNPSDVIIFTGQPPGTIPLVNCAVGTYSVQQGLLQYSVPGKQMRLSGIIVISQTAAIPPGSRLVVTSSGGTCADAGIEYFIYFGTV